MQAIKCVGNDATVVVAGIARNAISTVFTFFSTVMSLIQEAKLTLTAYFYLLLFRKGLKAYCLEYLKQAFLTVSKKNFCGPQTQGFFRNR